MLVIDDIGSGALWDFSRYGVAGEPQPQQSIQAGSDVVLFSGDKLLGGPQCGIILGKRNLVHKVNQHPLARALRVDKITLAALAATLRLYQDPEQAEQSIPLLMLLSTPAENLKHLCRSARSPTCGRPCYRFGRGRQRNDLPRGRLDAKPAHSDMVCRAHALE